MLCTTLYTFCVSYILNFLKKNRVDTCSQYEELRQEVILEKRNCTGEGRLDQGTSVIILFSKVKVFYVRTATSFYLTP